MLSPFDDYPVHQVIEPLRLVGTTDRNFYDRYYFNMHSCGDELVMAAGLGCYPNRGVVDAYVAVLHAGVHRVVRASGVLSADRAVTKVGPISIDVLEGLMSLRLRVEEGGDVDLDLTWTGAIAAQAEPRHRLMRNGRTVMDMCRFTQTGTWQGTITIAGESFDVAPDRWWGVRDRSWGVRPIGEPGSGGIDAATPPSGHLWNWAPMQFADKTILVSVQEDSLGRRSHEQALVVPTDRGEEPIDLGSPRHEWSFAPGTRQLSGGVITFPEAAGELTEITVEPIVPMILSLGTGYGGEVAPQPGLSEWRHGMYQGDLVVESPSWTMASIPASSLYNATVDHVARFTTNTGDIGYGIVNYVFVGALQRYGFTGFTDGAR